MNREERVYSIGRAPTCDVVLADPSVSRHHAELHVLADGTLFLVDRASRNGTRIVGGGRSRSVRQEFIALGDTLQFGTVRVAASELVRGLGVETGAAPRSVRNPVPAEPRRRTPAVAGKNLERCGNCGAVKVRGEACRECES